MIFFPISLTLSNRHCLVVGGGEVAARKVDLLVRARARVTVVAPEICIELQDLCSSEQILNLSRFLLEISRFLLEAFKFNMA